MNTPFQIKDLIKTTLFYILVGHNCISNLHIICAYNFNIFIYISTYFIVFFIVFKVQGETVLEEELRMPVSYL